MLFRKYLLVVALLCTAGAWAQSADDAKPTTRPADAATLDSFAKIQEHFNTLQEESQKAIEKQRFAALEAFLPKAAADERENMVATMAGLALRLEMYEKSLALADQFLKDFPKSDGLSTMRRMRMAALVQSKRLPDAVKEWETLLKQAKPEQAQEVFQSGMQLAELCTDADDPKAARQLYDTIREKIPGLVPEQQRQMASQSIDEAIAPRLALLDMIGKEPAALEGKSLAGEKIDLAKYKGKVVLLDFWATWCKPCVAALPEVKAAYAKYHERGFEVVGVSLDVQKQNLEDFIKAQGIAWPQIWDNEGKEGTPNPFGGPNTRRYNITAIPATYLIDRDGRIVRANVSSDSLDETIRKTLDKPATQPAGAAVSKTVETGKKP